MVEDDGILKPFSAPIHAVARHRVGVDGDGVSTLVTFYECPLSCKYCLNPSTLGKIPNDCYMTPRELYDKVEIDDLYFRVTGGGVTFGGGEPCLRSHFIRKFSRLCNGKWKLRVETSLNVPLRNIKDLIFYVDLFIVDVKTCDESIYKRYTGRDNKQVVENLEFLSKCGFFDKVCIRLPLIEGYVDEETRRKSMEYLQSMGFERFDLFTYKTRR